MQSSKAGAPLLTIITAVKNQAQQLENTIKNVFSLQYDKIDYIVIDGGSKDGTYELIKKNRHRIKFWISEKDNGLYEALNKGWQVADINSYIIILGAGDQLINIPTKDMKILSSMDKVIFGRVKIGETILFKPKINWLTKSANTLHHQGLLVPKKLHPKEPFDTKYKIYADFDFNQRLIKCQPFVLQIIKNRKKEFNT